MTTIQGRHHFLAARQSLATLICIALGMWALSSCSAATPNAPITPTAVALATSAPVLTPTQSPTATQPATATSTAIPSPSPTATRIPPVATPAQPLSLTIVHTNDTWGYTLPCG